MQQIKENIKNLESLRGFLSLVVVIAHSFQVFFRPSHLFSNQLYEFIGLSARAAVLCFFCLSGFVIASSIESNIKRHGKFKLSEYTLSRVFRIVPPLIAVIAIVFFLQYILIFFGASEIDIKNAARTTFKTEPLKQFAALLTLGIRGDILGGGFNGPLWSLAFEIEFYVIAGLLATIINSKKWFVKSILIIITIIYFKKIGLPIHKKPELDIKIIAASSFLFGVIAYKIKMLSKKNINIILASLATIIILFATYYCNEGSVYDMDKIPSFVILQILISALFSVLILRVSKLNEFLLFNRMSTYSYTLYILHFPVLLFFYFTANHFTKTILSDQFVAATMLTSTIFTIHICSYFGRFIEKPRLHREATTLLFKKIYQK